MAHPQRPQYGQQFWGKEQGGWLESSAQRHDLADMALDLSRLYDSQQSLPYEQQHHAKSYQVHSQAEYAPSQTTQRVQRDQEPNTRYQPNEEPLVSSQQQGRWNGEIRQGWHMQEQDLGSRSVAAPRHPPDACFNVGPLYQEKFWHQKPSPAPLNRSYSHEVSPEYNHAQATANTEKSQVKKPPRDERSRCPQRGKPVGALDGNHAKLPKKGEKERIVIEPSSPDTISWDNPFPTFPTSKKKATPAEYASQKSASSRGDPQQRPRTAGSERIRNDRSQEREPRRKHGTEGPVLSNRKLSNENGVGGVFKQKTNGNYSLPSSPLATNFPPRPFKTDSSMVNGIQDQFVDHKIAIPEHMNPPNQGWQVGSQSVESEPSFVRGQYPVDPSQVAENDCRGQFLPHDRTDRTDDRKQGYRNAPSHSFKDYRLNSAPSYDGDQGTGRQQFTEAGVGFQSLSEDDMPDFSVLALADTLGVNRPTEDLHLQPSSGIPVHPQVRPSPQVERGRAPQQFSTKFAAQAQRSQSQPNHRNLSPPVENQMRGFDFSGNEILPTQNPLAAQVTQPLVFQSHPTPRGQSAGQNQTVYSTPSLNYSYQDFPHPAPSSRQPINTRGPSPMAGPVTHSDQVLSYSAKIQRPNKQSVVGSYDGAHAGSASRNMEWTMRPNQQNPDAIPSQPPPTRPGLANQSMRPPPIRQYGDGTPSYSQPGPPPPPPSTNSQHTRAPSNSLAKADIGQLQQAVQANPNDMKAQLALAKKMVEMSSVLADQDGRADPKQRARNREKYILDAHKMVKKLVNSGYVEAMFHLADCYGRGLLGLETDPKEAFNLYSSAAKLGHPASAYRVAVCCEMGQDEGGGTRRDPLKAVQWYKRAATLGDTPAMYKMGMIQLKGLLGQPRNPREAIVWLKRAAERADEENPHALHELGLLFESAGKNDNIIRDEAYSLQLFTEAATLGYKFSQHRLGAAYEYGSLGCVIDARQSIAWYSKAAVQEEHQSELALSGWYLTGSESVLQQSDTEAYLWARKAAHAGLAKAEYAMGYFTEVGIGAPANLEDAKRWYWRAASQNFPKARERLEDLRKGGARMEKSRVSRSAVSKGSDGDCLVM